MTKSKHELKQELNMCENNPVLQNAPPKFSAQRITTLAMLTAMGLIMFILEGLMPPIGLPGAKMGLSNIFSLLTLILLGPVDAIILVVIRTVLGSLFGNVATLIYSLTAGLVSILVSILLVYVVFPRISLLSVSVAAAVMHNITQNVVFCLQSGTRSMLFYLPYLALVGVLAGLIVGFAVFLVVKLVPLPVFARANGLRD